MLKDIGNITWNAVLLGLVSVGIAIGFIVAPFIYGAQVGFTLFEEHLGRSKEKIRATRNKYTAQ